MLGKVTLRRDGSHLLGGVKGAVLNLWDMSEKCLVEVVPGPSLTQLTQYQPGCFFVA